MLCLARRIRAITTVVLLLTVSALATTGVSVHHAQALTSLDADWSTSLNGSTTENNFQVLGSSIDKDGNIYVVGMTSGMYDIDPGASTTTVSLDRRAMIAKFDSAGAYVWHFAVGAANSAWRGISFEPNGEQFWVTGSICGGNGAQVFNFNRTGSVLNGPSYPIGTCQSTVVKYDTNGTVVTNPSTLSAIMFRLSTSTTASYSYSVDASATAMYVVGSFYSATASPVDFNPLGTSSPVVGARTAGGSDAFIAKYDSVGILSWVKTLGSSVATGNEIAWGVQLDSSENVYVHGFMTSSTNYDLGGGAISFATQRQYLVKWNSSGTFQWGFNFGGTDTGSYDRIKYMAVAPNGTVYMGGHQAGTFDFRGTLGIAKSITTPTNAYGGYIVSFNSAGEYRWHVALALKTHPSGTTQNLSIFESVAVTADGGVFAAGHFRGTMDFDGSASEYLLSPSTASCRRDRFVAKYSSTGDLQWAERPESACAVGTPNDINLGGNHWISTQAVGSGALAIFRSYSPVPKFMIQYGADTAAPGSPASSTLVVASDTGASTSDAITSDSTPTVNVVAAEAGGTVALTAQRQGSADVVCNTTGATGSGSDCTFATLADGAWSVTGVHTDGAGNISGASAALVIIVDTDAPALQSVSPTTDAVGISTSQNVVLTFDEDVAKGTGGSVMLRNGGPSCPTTAQTTLVSNAAVSVVANVATYNPPLDLVGSTLHCVSFASGVFQDVAGNYAPAHDPLVAGGIRFTTHDGTIPTATWSVPSSPTSSRSLSYTVSFSESVSGIAASDFVVTGTASGCVLTTTSSIASPSVSVTVVCQSDGTVDVALGAYTVVDSSSASGPSTASQAGAVTIVTTTSTTTPSTTIPVSSAGTTTTTAPGTTVPTAAATGGSVDVVVEDGDVALVVEDELEIAGTSGSATASDGSVIGFGKTGSLSLKLWTGYIGKASGSVRATYKVRTKSVAWSCTIASVAIGKVNKNAKRTQGNWFPKKLMPVANRCVLPSALRTALKKQKVVLTAKVKFVKWWPTTGKAINALTGAKIPVGTRTLRITLGTSPA